MRGFGEVGRDSAFASDFAEADGEEDEDGEGCSGGCGDGSYEDSRVVTVGVGRGGLGWE